MEIKYEHLNQKYRKAQLIGVIISYAVLMGLALLLLMTGEACWCVAAEIVLGIALVVNIAIIPKAFKAKSFALCEYGIIYCRGIIFPKNTTVPFSKIQQVSVEQNPVTKCLKLYTLEIVNGAQSLSSLRIPGLDAETANELKVIVTAKILQTEL